MGAEEALTHWLVRYATSDGQLVDGPTHGRSRPRNLRSSAVISGDVYAAVHPLQAMRIFPTLPMRRPRFVQFNSLERTIRHATRCRRTHRAGCRTRYHGRGDNAGHADRNDECGHRHWTSRTSQWLPELGKSDSQSGKPTRSRPSPRTTRAGSGWGAVVNVVAPTEFYVVDDASRRSDVRVRCQWRACRVLQSQHLLYGPRGRPAPFAGDKTWVVDANRNVYVYDASGDRCARGLLGL